jgi:DNA-binding response OmpR family regulator
MPMQRVLIVEDNEGFAETLAEVLKSRGFQTHWVATPEEAHAEAEARRYDLMIIDHGLEGQSGIELARRLANNNLVDRVVFLTGRVSMNDNEIPANLKDRAAVLHKPVEMDDLVATIRRLTAAL